MKRRKLWSVKKEIFGFWTNNGNVKIGVMENGPIYNISHMSDLESKFPQIDFNII